MFEHARDDGRLQLVSLVKVMSVFFLLGALAPRASARRADGPIAFTSDRGGQSDLWVMDADGSNAVNLTNDKIEDDFAAWSPDGKQIAWTRGGRGPEGEIWVMNADGSDKRQVTFNGFSDYNATWSPDGTRLAFRSFRAGNRDIYVINVDGTGEQRLTNDAASDFAPDWSPDGTKIAFTSLRSGGHSAIYVMDTDGNNVIQLTADSQEAALPGWSPDGTKIVYGDGFCATCGESDVFVMNADGSGVTQITNSAENELAKSWSRTGARVVADFSLLSPSGTRLSKADIAVIDVATGAITNLTNTNGINEEHPDWSPAPGPLVPSSASNSVADRDVASTARTLAIRISPNPGHGRSTLSYTLPHSGHVQLRIFDVAGHEVANLVDRWEAQGAHDVPLPRGARPQVLFYRLDWEGKSASGKISVVP